MHYKELADKVRYYKENEKGVASMCKVLEEMRNEYLKTNQNNLETIQKLKETISNLEKIIEENKIKMLNYETKISEYE